MQTYTYRQGTTPYPMILSADDSSAPYDLTGVTVTLDLTVGATCVAVPVTIIEPLIGLVAPDATMLDDITPRARRGTLRAAWPDGTKDAAEIAVVIQGGC